MATLVIERVLPAPIEKVFGFMTKEKNLLVWWGPEGMTVPEGNLDFTKPGPWYSVMQNGDGKRFKVSGQVTTVIPFERVAFTWAWHDEKDIRGHESQVIIDLVGLDTGQTKMTLSHHDLADDESSKNHEMGWTSSLRKLDRLFNNQTKGD
jgi:uncharacterized protein YndB with AHSA1/START domain